MGIIIQNRIRRLRFETGEMTQRELARCTESEQRRR